jgi:thiosulfate dehydrogenase
MEIIMKKIIIGKRILAFSVVLLSGLLNHAYAAVPENPTDQWKIGSGGALYDNWASALMKSPPTDTHPAYPKDGKKKGKDTWRCKECHGWDYKGAEGAYKKGSHYTGVKGIRNMVGTSTDEIKKIIRNDTHKYDNTMIPDIALDNLAEFVSHGQLDTAQYIDYSTKKARGDTKQGARYYQTICAICHGFDGKQINFKPAKPNEPEYIGTVANDNPWEVLHKIRNGQPGVPMVSLGVLDSQDQVDILSYAQTLPTK